MAERGAGRWRRLLALWRTQKEELEAAGEVDGQDLVSVLSLIEAERNAWTGTKRTVCTEAELEQRFKRREVLGHGTYGTVYRVFCSVDAKELAVKVIENRSDAERAEIIHESELWQTICSPFHPSILPLLEVIEVSDAASIHLLTPCMEWGNLAEALQDPGVDRSEQAARLIMVQLVSAMAHLHIVHSIAHRDVKPANVLCEGPDPSMAGCLKLCDFGYCKRFDSRTAALFDDPVGTPHYASPELAASWLSTGQVAWAGAPADCWALGVTAYQIIAGYPPYERRSLRDNDATLVAIASPMASDAIEYPARSFGRLSEEGKSFLERLLTRSPTERASVQEALEHPWLQPVADKTLRERMAQSAPGDARARGKWRLAVRRLVLANRLMGLRPTTRSTKAPPSVGRLRTPLAQTQESASSMASSFRRANSGKISFRTKPSKAKASPHRGVKTMAGAPSVLLPEDMADVEPVRVDADVDPILYYVAAHKCSPATRALSKSPAPQQSRPQPVPQESASRAWGQHPVTGVLGMRWPLPGAPAPPSDEAYEA